MKVKETSAPQYELTLNLSEAVSACVLYRRFYNGLGPNRKTYEEGMDELVQLLPADVRERLLEQGRLSGSVESWVREILQDEDADRPEVPDA